MPSYILEYRYRTPGCKRAARQWTRFAESENKKELEPIAEIGRAAGNYVRIYQVPTRPEFDVGKRVAVRGSRRSRPYSRRLPWWKQ